MLDQVNSFFGIVGDYDLNLMTPNQTLSGLTSRCIYEIEKIIFEYKHDIVFVQGDKTTVMSAAVYRIIIKFQLHT